MQKAAGQASLPKLQVGSAAKRRAALREPARTSTKHDFFGPDISGKGPLHVRRSIMMKAQIAVATQTYSEGKASKMCSLFSSQTLPNMLHFGTNIHLRMGCSSLATCRTIGLIQLWDKIPDLPQDDSDNICIAANLRNFVIDTWPIPASYSAHGEML